MNFKETRFPAWWGFINFLAYAETQSSMPFSGEMAALVNISTSVLRQKAAVFGKRWLNIWLLLDALDFHPEFCSTSSPAQNRGKKERPCSGNPPSWNSSSAKISSSNKKSGFSGLVGLLSIVSLPQADSEEIHLCPSCSVADEHHLDRNGCNEIFICMKRESRF